MIQVNKFIGDLKPSSTLAINQKVHELRRQGNTVFHFGFGQSPFPVPEKIVEALKNHAHRKEYLPIQGLPKLRENISKYLLKNTIPKIVTNIFRDLNKFHQGFDNIVIINEVVIYPQMFFYPYSYKNKNIEDLLTNIYEKKILDKNGIIIIHRHKKEKDESAVYESHRDQRSHARHCWFYCDSHHCR